MIKLFTISDLTMHDYIIVANGPFLVREIIEAAIQGKKIIALDGAANKLWRLGIRPHIILGDFDSVQETKENIWGIKQTFNELEEKSEPYLGTFGVTIVPAKNQDLTDLVKAIQYCDEKNAKSISIICASGGRLDHHEGVMMALRSEYKKDRVILLHTEQQTLRHALDETVTVLGEPGDKCGVIATHTGTFRSKGLVWDGHNHSESICNVFKGTTATITVTGSALLIMPPLLPEQREFMKKTEVERLELLLRDAKAKPTSQLCEWLKHGMFATTTCVATVAKYCALTYTRTMK